MILWLFVTLFSHFVYAAAVTSDFATVCAASLGEGYLFGGPKCTVFEYNARLSCACSNPAFAPTVVSCIDQAVIDVANTAPAMQNATLIQAYQAFRVTCPNISMSTLEAWHANVTSLPPYDGDAAFTKLGNWSVPHAFAPSHKYVRDVYMALVRYDDAVGLNNRYGSVLVGYWGCLAVIKMLSRFASAAAPRKAMAIKNTAIGRFWRSETTRHYRFFGILGMTSLQFLMISGFVLLAATFSFADLPVWYPTYFYGNSNAATYTSQLGRRTGLLFVYIMPLFILFAGRNNFLQWLTGWSIGPFVIFHKWVARVGVLILLVHAIAYSICFAIQGDYTSAWDSTYWQWGVVGFSFGAFLFVHAVRFLRCRAYDLFLVLHIFGAIMFICAGFQHVKLLMTQRLLYFFYATFAVWGFDRGLRIVRVLCSGVREPAILELKHDILILTIKRPKLWNLRKRPGQYVFIHFWHLSVFWQSHPFTIVSCGGDYEHLRLFCKVHSGATRQIASLLADEDDDEVQSKAGESEKSSGLKQDSKQNVFEQAAKMKLNVLLDGPYGHSHNLSHFEEIVFIAGGTGIAGPFDYLQRSLHDLSRRSQKLRLFWAVKREDEVEKWFEHELSLLRLHTYVEVSIYSSRTQRMDVAATITKLMEDATGPLAIMSCGPDSMIAAARNAFANNLPKTRAYVEYFEERITW